MLKLFTFGLTTKRLGLCKEIFLFIPKSRKNVLGLSLHWEYMLFTVFVEWINIDQANINYISTSPRIKIVKCKLKIFKIFFNETWVSYNFCHCPIEKYLSYSGIKIKHVCTTVCLDLIWTSLILYFLTFLKLLFIPEGLVLVLPSSQVFPERKRHIMSFLSWDQFLHLILSRFSSCFPSFSPLSP